MYVVCGLATLLNFVAGCRLVIEKQVRLSLWPIGKKGKPGLLVDRARLDRKQDI